MDKLYVLESQGNVIIRVNVDTIVLHEKKIVAISLYDAPALVDKIVADLRADAETYLVLHERSTGKKDSSLKAFSSNGRYNNSLSISFSGKYKINLDASNTRRKHALIISDNVDYAFNFNEENPVDFFK